MTEEWRDIPGWEGSYQVSNMGNVRSLSRWVDRPSYRSKKRWEEGIILKTRVNRKGYPYLSLRYGGRRYIYTIHHLVALAFLDKPRLYANQINHKNCNKQDNRVENLEWVTNAENMAHARANGLVAKGESIHTAKLTTEQVIEVKRLIAAKQLTFLQIATMFGVKSNTITSINRGESWLHVGEYTYPIRVRYK